MGSNLIILLAAVKRAGEIVSNPGPHPPLGLSWAWAALELGSGWLELVPGWAWAGLELAGNGKTEQKNGNRKTETEKQKLKNGN